MPNLADLLRFVISRRERLVLTVPESSFDANIALAIPTDECPVAMIIGRAGTGKSTLIRSLMNAPAGGRRVVVAPTGRAALNVEGQTIHSFFKIPSHIVDPLQVPVHVERRQTYENLELLIIDEMSMLRCDLLDVVNNTLQVNRGNKKPFGGVKVVLVGDFLQLPPVVTRHDRQQLQNIGYTAHHSLFGARALGEIDVKCVKLEKVFRQDDAEFVRILDQLRKGDNLVQSVQAINDWCYHPHRSSATPVILTATNDLASGYNQGRLAHLPGASRTYAGILQGDFDQDEKTLPVQRLLELKSGARIVMAKNDSARKWVNGSLGVVTLMQPDRVSVRLDGCEVDVEVCREKWESFDHVWSQEENRMVAISVGSYTQLPLKLAWAMTIHKSQGLTLDDVRINLAGGAFAAGQTYVALSRTRSVSGLSLEQPVAVGDVRVDPLLVEMEEALSRDAVTWPES